jgi:low temperature requirement protein LtrA
VTSTSLFSPPRLRTGEGAEDERHASWLELFFDLVFVVAITQLGVSLSHDVSAAGFLRFAGLFVPVWWAWIGYTFYADRFDSDDVIQRVAMLLGMLAIAALAVNVGNVAAGSTTGFALSYVAVRAIVIALYVRARRAVPEARELCTFYLIGFSAGTALWVASLPVSEPPRYWLWGIGLVIEVATPLLAGRIIQRIPVHASHIPERFGLFTMIVFGESVVAVAGGTASSNWQLASAVTACLGFVAVGTLWWIYFDFVDRDAPLRHGVARGQTYVYGHLPLLAALTSTGVGVKLAILAGASPALRDDARVALAGGVAVLLLTLSLILAVCEPGFDRGVLAVRLIAAAGASLLAIAGGRPAPPLLAGLVAAILLADLVVEIMRREQRPRQSRKRAEARWEPSGRDDRWTRIHNA